MYQLCLGEDTFASLVDRITDRACAVAPRLDRDACRRLVELVFRARVRKTEACGNHPACSPGASVWGRPGDAPPGDTAGWQDFDPEGLPAMFGAAAADLADVGTTGRKVVEERLASAFRIALAQVLYENPRCGHDPVCSSEPVFPYAALTSRRSRGKR